MAKQESFGTLSGIWVKRAVDITDCLIGEGYNYLHYNVTSVKPPKDFPRASIVLGLRVEVEERDRPKVTQNILKALSEKDVTGAKYLGKYTYVMNSDGTGPQKENRIDIPIKVGKQPQKLYRIEVKPVKGGGSGGGSASTAINECMFAVYAAIRFHLVDKDLDPSKGLDEELRKKAYDNHCSLDRPLKDLWADPVWHHAHCIGANKLYSRQECQVKNPHFYRGSGFDDAEIKQAYQRVNIDLKAQKKPHFTAEDKWNPSDIWMAEKGFDISPLNNLNTAAEINKFFDQKYASKELVGVSLKKLGPQANFAVLNEEPPAQRKAKVDTFKWINKNGTGGYDLLFENRGGNPIDVYLYYGSGFYDKFQLRNFGGKKASWQIELKGATAAHGRCGGGNVAEIVNKYAPGAMPWNNDPFYNQCNPDNRSNRIDITQEIAKLLVDFKAKNVKGKKQWERDQTQYEEIISEQSTEWRYSKLNGLRLLKALEDNKGAVADQIVQALYLFASSQLDFSSVFVKVY